MLVMFDFDGTPADTWPWLAEELVAGAGRFGYPQITRAEIEGLRRLETQAVLERLAIPIDRLPSIVAHLRRLAEAVVVGDETRDLDAARSAGIRAAVVEWGYADPALLRARAPGRSAASVEQLLDLLTGVEEQA